MKVDDLLYGDEINLHNRKVRRKKNVYLNSLIRLMGGECTSDQLGLIPIDKIPILTRKEVIYFMEDNADFASTLDAIIESKAEIAF